MTSTADAAAAGLRIALQYTSSSARLQAALQAGTHPEPAFVAVLVDRCAVEPDFFVRDMLTWALVRHPVELTVPRLLYEVGDESPQARSQALHTLSKIGDPRGWSVVTSALLRDAHDDVARSAWRTAVILLPEGRAPWLAGELVGQLGRGDRDLQRSLSRALAELGYATAIALAPYLEHRDTTVRTHAIATERIMEDPDEGFEQAIAEAQRVVALEVAASLLDDGDEPAGL